MSVMQVGQPQAFTASAITEDSLIRIGREKISVSSLQYLLLVTNSQNWTAPQVLTKLCALTSATSSRQNPPHSSGQLFS